MILIVGAMTEELCNIKSLPNTMIINTGIGKVNAAMKLTEAISNNNLTAIYNFGFAGASHHFEVGDVVLVKSAKYHDFDLTFFGYEKGQVPNYPVEFESNKDLMNQVISKIEHIKTSHLFTGDYFMTEKSDAAYVVDMEGAALYQVAYYYQIPIVSIKVISDIIGMDKHYENYKTFESSKGAQIISDIYEKILKESSK
ncbi:MAG: 5'-methylthioadenosine/S-adenosylhomocysteine nucleosidase [Acholeplasmataceae bacterium]